MFWRLCFYSIGLRATGLASVTPLASFMDLRAASNNNIVCTYSATCAISGVYRFSLRVELQNPPYS